MLGSRLDLHEMLRRYPCTAMVARASLVCAALLAASVGHAQVTTQVTGNGLGTTVTNTASGVEITGGARAGAAHDGANLFHSFGLFNVGSGDTAKFTNNSGLPTTNIIGRITGARSDIFGTIQTTGLDGFGTANLWLINPRGFVFGPNAMLDVAGSFHASTADYLKFSDGRAFDMNTSDVVMLTADPSAFGFLGTPTGKIEVLTGAVDYTTDPVTITNLLNVPQGKTLSLVGGEIKIGGQVDLNNDGTPDVSGTGYLLAPGGHVNLVSVASAGEATFDDANINGSTTGLPVTGDPGTRDIDVSGFGKLGNINITQGSVVDAKEVSISGGQLGIDTSAVYPGAFFLTGVLGTLQVSGIWEPAKGIFDLPLPDGGLVNVYIAGDLSIRGNTLVPVIDDLPGILSFAGLPVAEVPGDAPDIRVNAHSLKISGQTADIQSVRFGPGAAGDIYISADTIRLENGANIEAINFFQGPGGNITVSTGDLVIDGSGSSGFTGISSQALFHPGYLLFSVARSLYFADAGTVTVNASDVTVRNSGRIGASSFTFGSGGAVTVNTKNLSLDNFAAITAESTLGGAAGSVEINASGQVNLASASQISSTTSGSGNGGDVLIKADQSTTVSGSSGVFASTVAPNQAVLDFFGTNFDPIGWDYATLESITTSVTGIPDPSIFDVLGVLRLFGLLNIPDSMLEKPGDGGTISLTTPLLTVSNRASISSSTTWGFNGGGNAGAVTGTVGSLNVESDGEIRSRAGLVDSSGQVFAVGEGNAGTLNFSANNITISGGSMSTTTIGDGKGGDIVLNAAQNVNITNGGSVSADSLALAATDATGGVGGDTGSVEITAGNSITLDGGTISTRAVAADGGNISLFAPNIVYLNNSQITTSVESGVGGGGNILIDPQFVILNNSSIIANAYGGPGGNITIIADNYLASATSVVQASSALSTPGVIRIVSPENNIESTIAQLASEFLDASSLLRGLCSARRTGAASSFTVANRGGVPVEADGYLPSFSIGAANGSASVGAPLRANALDLGGERVALALVMPDTLDCTR